MNKETPSKEKKKELKSYTFTLILPNDKETPKGPKDEKPNFKLADEKSDKIILNFTLNFTKKKSFSMPISEKKISKLLILFRKRFLA